VVRRHLKPGGEFLANVTAERSDGRRKGRWQGFPVNARPVDFYSQAAAGHGLETSIVGTLAELGHVSGNEDQDAGVMLAFRSAA
jgi:hypothetical protein